MKTIEKIELIKKMKIYEQKFGFDEKLQNAQEKIALADDEEMKKLFAEYIVGADKEYLLEKRMTVEEITRKTAEEEVIENFLGPIALGDDPADNDIDKPVFVDNLSTKVDSAPPMDSFDVLMAQTGQVNKDKWQDERGKPTNDGGFKLTADDFEGDDKFQLSSDNDDFISGADMYESSIEARNQQAVSEEERAQKASDIVARMGGTKEEKKPVEEEPKKKPEPAKKYTSNEKHTKTGSTGTALLVAFLLGLVGCGLFGLVYYLGYLSGWVAFITIFLAAFGYKKVKGEMDTKGYVFVSLLTVLEMVVSLFVCYGLELQYLLELPSIFEGVKSIFSIMMEYPEMKSAFFTDLIMTAGFSVVGVVFFLVSERTSKKGK